jgi:hypothetical protein
MDLDDLRRLAGINEFKGYTPYEGSNISITGTEKAEIQRKENIRPGDKEWFELWFSKPYLTGTQFRGRSK